ncbi:MAG TPA: peptidase M23 [Bacteroidales bacterium]|nr:peptidase M23 [Bacteroidales bacterium]
MWSSLREQYRYNPRTLSYDKVKFSPREIIFKLLGIVLFFSTGIFLVSFLIFSYFFDTTSYRAMQREKQQLVTQYNILLEKLEQADNVLVDIQKRDDNIYRTMLNKEPIHAAVRNAGFGGTDRYEKLRGFENSGLIIEAHKKMDVLSKRLVVQSESFDDIAKLATDYSKMLTAIPAILPVSLKEGHITSTFGFRIHPILRSYKMHTGVDFSAPRGTAIYATGDGVVEATKYLGGYGRQITINHGFGYRTRYAHLHKILVRNGQKIKRGDLIGEVGSSGLSTSNHLHYEVIHKGDLINPVDYYFNDIDPKTYSALKK